MALFHQHGFSQPPLPPPQGFFQPPPHMGYLGAYQMPPPMLPPMLFHDPSSFRRDYAARLSSLTMNSRPIIQSLSMIAQESTRFADIVAQCLEAHIRRVPPWMKLPAFYVLDAISKNVHDPYAAKFSAFIVPLFLESYRLVDDQTKSKMDEMLVTWRTGGPTGKELFGVATQVNIERSVWGNDTTSAASELTSRRGQQPQVIKSQVLAELEVTLAEKERLAAVSPYDSNVNNQVVVLHQLRRLVEQGVSQEELGQILQQLRSMCRESAPPPPPPVVYGALPALQHQSLTSSHLPSFTQTGPPSGFNTVVPMQPAAFGQTSAPSESQTHVSDAANTPAPSIPNNFSDLFKNLVRAGLVTASSSNTPTGAGSSAIQDVSDSCSGTPEPPESVLEASRTYANKVLDLNVKLSSSDMSRRTPQLITSLYDEQAIQCKQCARRFPDSVRGRKRLQDHLDVHFTQNRKFKEVGRGHSRSWFVSIDDFVKNAGATDLSGKGKGRASTNSNSDLMQYVLSSDVEDVAKRVTELRSSYIVVPAGEETMTVLCPVCKESMKSEFLEDEEEWVWRNATRVKDKIYHATCHSEMIASSTVASRLRSEGGASLSNSRPATPDLKENSPSQLRVSTGKGRTRSKSPSPDRVAGTKRKVLDDEERQTPPMKKLAPSPSIVS